MPPRVRQRMSIARIPGACERSKGRRRKTIQTIIEEKGNLSSLIGRARLESRLLLKGQRAGWCRRSSREKGRGEAASLHPAVAPRGSKCNSTHPQFLTPYPHVSLLDYVVEVGSHGDRKPPASRLAGCCSHKRIINKAANKLKSRGRRGGIKTPMLTGARVLSGACLAVASGRDRWTEPLVCQRRSGCTGSGDAIHPVGGRRERPFAS